MDTLFLFPEKERLFPLLWEKTGGAACMSRLVKLWTQLSLHSLICLSPHPTPMLVTCLLQHPCRSCCHQTQHIPLPSERELTPACSEGITFLGAEPSVVFQILWSQSPVWSCGQGDFSIIGLCFRFASKTMAAFKKHMKPFQAGYPHILQGTSFPTSFQII